MKKSTKAVLGVVLAAAAAGAACIGGMASYVTGTAAKAADSVSM